MPDNKATALSLVYSFSASSPDFQIEEHLGDWESVARGNAQRRLENAASLASVNNYLIQHEMYKVTIQLENEEDRMLTSMAMSHEAEVEMGFWHGPQDGDFRKLKNIRHTIQHQIRKTDLKGQIYINIDRQERVLVVEATNTIAFFRFKDYMTEMGLFEPIADVQAQTTDKLTFAL